MTDLPDSARQAPRTAHRPSTAGADRLKKQAGVEKVAAPCDQNSGPTDLGGDRYVSGGGPA